MLTSLTDKLRLLKHNFHCCEHLYAYQYILCIKTGTMILCLADPNKLTF